MNTEPIVIPINGDPSDFIADSNRVTGGMDNMGNAADIAAKKGAILSTVLATTSAILKTSYDEYSKLAESIRDLSLVSGESAESTSRFIQVLDDYQITAGDAEAAAKKLKDNGLSPTIDTLAMLSDQFRGIKDPAERLDFVYDKLGKSGAKFINMLDQGSDKIRENAAAINESLILSDFEIKMYEVGRLAIDEKADALAALRVELGQNIGNVLAFAKAMERASQIQEESTKFVNGHKERTIEYADALNMAIAEQLKAADASAEYKYNLEEEAKALKEVSAANADLIKGAIDITRENENFAEKQQAVIDKIAETRAEGEKLYPWEHEKILENQQALEDLGQQYFDNLEDFKAAQEEKLAMMAIEKIAMSDGVAGYSEAEYEKARAILETQDVATAAAFEQQQAMETLTTAVADGQITVEEYAGIWKEASADGVISISEVTAAIENVPSGKTVTFDIITNGAPPNLDTSTAAMNAPRGTHRNSNAMGGEFMIPMSYGNEGFMMGGGDTASGGEMVRITPRGQDPNAALIAAIYATKTDEARLARMIAEEVLKVRR